MIASSNQIVNPLTPIISQQISVSQKMRIETSQMEVTHFKQNVSLMPNQFNFNDSLIQTSLCDLINGFSSNAFWQDEIKMAFNATMPIQIIFFICRIVQVLGIDDLESTTKGEVDTAVIRIATKVDTKQSRIITIAVHFRVETAVFGKGVQVIHT